ncbi:MAG: hypothetical protein ACRDPA_05520, partial [Solirubrobacteraceae bacterium]
MAVQQISRRVHWRVIGVIGGVIALALGWVVEGAGARSVGSGQPLAVQAASLMQEGQDLVWQVELTRPFSPGALRRDGRSVCLLLERAANGSVVSRVCLAGPRRGARVPRLIYVPLTRPARGRGGVIAATVTRSSDRELTASFLPASVGLRYRSLRWQVISILAVPGCVLAVPGQTGCTTLFRAKPALVRLHTPRLVGCEPAGPAWVFHGPANKREIALTFDD